MRAVHLGADPSSAHFSPKTYIQHSLSDVTHDTLEKKLVEDVFQAKETTDQQLKSLIRENLGTFIESKDAMKSIFELDKSLFSHEALGELVTVFEDGKEECVEVIQPIADAYQGLRVTRQEGKLLVKFQAITSAPTIIYRACGVRVAVPLKKLSNRDVNANVSLSTTHLLPLQSSFSSKPMSHVSGKPVKDVIKKPRKSEGCISDSDSDSFVSDEEEDPLMGTTIRELESRAGPSTMSVITGVRGTTSESRIAGSSIRQVAGSSYHLEPHEVLLWWHGTPLVKSALPHALSASQSSSSSVPVAQRGVGERGGKDASAATSVDAALQNFRRALVFLEEHYDLETGERFSASEEKGAKTENENEISRATLSSTMPEESMKRRTSSAGLNMSQAVVHHQTTHRLLIFNYVTALLRSSLFLLDFLSDTSLMAAKPGDTVFVESTLNMMIEISLGTVKLRGFARVLAVSLYHADEASNPLLQLRNALLPPPDVAVKSRAQPSGSPYTPFYSNVSAFSQGSGGGYKLRAASSEVGTARCVPVTAMVSAPLHGDHYSLLQSGQWHPVQLFIAILHIQFHRAVQLNARPLLARAREVILRLEAAEAASVSKEMCTEEGETSSNASPSSSLSGSSLRAEGEGASLNKPHSPLKDGAEKEERLRAKNHLKKVSRIQKESKMLALAFSPRFQADSLSPLLSDTRSLEDNLSASLPFPGATPLPSPGGPHAGSKGEPPLDITPVLIASCDQMAQYTAELLRRWEEGLSSNTERPELDIDIAQLLHSTAVTLENTIANYWSGIAQLIHAGLFESRYEEAKGGVTQRFLQHELEVTAASEKTSSALPSHSRAEVSTAASSFYASEKSRSGELPNPLHAQVESALPPLVFLPAFVPGRVDFSALKAAKAALEDEPSADADNEEEEPHSLSDYSVFCVRLLVAHTGVTLRRSFAAFIHQCMVRVFFHTVQQASEEVHHEDSEHLELCAALLVELLVEQWEKILRSIVDSMHRIIVSIGEAFSANVALTESSGSFDRGAYHVSGATSPNTRESPHCISLGDRVKVVADVEAVRAACVKTFYRGVGLVLNAYISLFPFMRRTGHDFLEKRVRARLSIEHVSSEAGNKLLNVLSVLLDRTLPFVRRHFEVYKTGELFADVEGEVLSPLASTPPAPQAFPVQKKASAEPSPLQRLSHFHHLLVLEGVQAQGKYIMQLCSDMLVCFVDMIHMKCQKVCAPGVAVSTEVQQREVVECLADTVCLTSTILPLLVNHLLSPCLFSLLVTLDPEIAVESRPAALKLMEEAFQQHHVSRVVEHAQLVLGAILQMHLVVPQQQMTRLVHRESIAKPGMDWQRVSHHTTSAVRPYLSDALLVIAEANEVLHWIQQPSLTEAVTQKLLAHLAANMMASLTVNANISELLSTDCSDDFFEHGSLLLEAEVATVCELLQKVVSSTPKEHIERELPSALAVLRQWYTKMAEQYRAMRELREKQKKGTDAEIVQRLRSLEAAHVERRQSLITEGLQQLEYLLDVVVAPKWSPISWAELGKPEMSSPGDTSSSSAPSSAIIISETIIQRLAKRLEDETQRDKRESAVLAPKVSAETKEEGEKKLPKARKKSASFLEAMNSAARTIVKRRRKMAGEKPQSPVSAGANVEDSSPVPQKELNDGEGEEAKPLFLSLRRRGTRPLPSNRSKMGLSITLNDEAVMISSDGGSLSQRKSTRSSSQPSSTPKEIGEDTGVSLAPSGAPAAAPQPSAPREPNKEENVPLTPGLGMGHRRARFTRRKAI